MIKNGSTVSKTLHPPVSPSGLDDRFSVQAQRVFEAQEKQKSIIMKKYTDQLNRLNLGKDLEKKLKKAENQVLKLKSEAHKKRLEFMQKKEQVIENYKSQVKNENKMTMIRIKEYEESQRERFEKWQEQEEQRQRERDEALKEHRKKREDVIKRLEDKEKEDIINIQSNLERIERRFKAQSVNYSNNIS